MGEILLAVGGALFSGFVAGVLLGNACGKQFVIGAVVSEFARWVQYNVLYADRYQIIDMKALCRVCPELKDCPHVDNRSVCWEYDEAVKKEGNVERVDPK